MKISRSSTHLDWTLTGGDLGAKLLESRDIKERAPILNRRERRHVSLYCFELVKGDRQHYRPKLIDRSCQGLRCDKSYFGLFRNKSQAQKTLDEIALQYNLCKKQLGLEKGAGLVLRPILKNVREPVSAQSLLTCLISGWGSALVKLRVKA